MLKLPLIIISAILILQAPSVRAQDSIHTRTVAAERYAGTFDFKSMWNGMALEMAKTRPVESRQKFIQLMMRAIDPDRVTQILVNVMVQGFNTEELNALADFYGTPVGQSILRKAPRTMAAIQPLMEREFRRAAADIRR